MMQTEIKIGLDFSAPIPLHSNFSSTTFEGFEVDLMKLISEKIGLKLNYEVALWKDILQKLKDGHLDFICSAVTITPQRELDLTFSEPYLSFKLCVVTNKENNINSLEDCKEKNIGVRIATEGETFIKNNLTESNLICSDTNEELYRLLSEGKIDLVIDDSPIAGAFIKLNNNLRLFLLEGTESHYGIAFKKDNLQGKITIDKILNEIKLDGYWHTLYDKWFKDARM